MDEDDVAARRGLGGTLEKAVRRAARIDEADRQAARRQVGDLRREPLDALAELDHRHLARRAGALGGIDDEDARAAFGEGGAQPLEHDAAEGDMRVGDDRHEARAGAGEHLAQAVGLVVSQGVGHGSGGEVSSGSIRR